jgi:hypothetical protein
MLPKKKDTINIEAIPPGRLTRWTMLSSYDGDWSGVQRKYSEKAIAELISEIGDSNTVWKPDIRALWNAYNIGHFAHAYRSHRIDDPEFVEAIADLSPKTRKEIRELHRLNEGADEPLRTRMEITYNKLMIWKYTLLYHFSSIVVKRCGDDVDVTAIAVAMDKLNVAKVIVEVKKILAAHSK